MMFHLELTIFDTLSSLILSAFNPINITPRIPNDVHDALFTRTGSPYPPGFSFAWKADCIVGMCNATGVAGGHSSSHGMNTRVGCYTVSKYQ